MFFIALNCLLAAAPVDPISPEALEQASAALGDAQSLTGDLIRQGKFAEARAVLEKRLPAAPTAVDWLAIGNAHFRLNPDASLEFHRKAYALAPTSARAALELAFDEHQHGDARAACPLYAQYLAATPTDAATFALLAECRLEANDLTGAIDAWKQAKVSRNHTRIESALSELFGPPSPWWERKRLLEAARASKDAAPVLALVSQAMVFRLDWWNTQPQPELIELDLRTFGARLSRDQKAAVALLQAAAKSTPDAGRRWKAFFQKPAADVPSEVLATMVEVGLPASLVTNEALAPVTALVRARAKGPQATQADVEFAAALAQSRDDQVELDVLDTLGWTRFHSLRCAQSFSIRHRTPVAGGVPLEDAVAANPESPFLRTIEFERLAPTAPDRKRVLVALLIAEFKHLELSRAGLHDAGALTSLFRQLEELTLAP